MKDFKDFAESDDFRGLVSVREARHDSGDNSAFKEAQLTLLKLITNTHMSKHKFGAALEEAAATTDFPILLGTIFEQTLITQYNNVTLDWKEYIKVGRQSDFRPTTLVNFHGLAKPLKQVAEHGEYKYTSAVESKVMSFMKKYGLMFGLTMEAIINDRYGAFKDIATPLARGAAKTEMRLATGMFASPTGPNPALFGAALVNPIDGVVLNNLFALDLTMDNLQFVVSKLSNQRDADGDPIMFEKVHVVVPVALQFRLMSILSSATQIVLNGGTVAAGKATPTMTTSENMLNKAYNIVPHVNPWLPSVDVSGNVDKTWYVFIDPNDAVGAQYNYLSNYETPQVMVKAPNQLSASGGSTGPESFENDTQEWKIRMFAGGAVVDGRAGAASVAP